MIQTIALFAFAALVATAPPLASAIPDRPVMTQEARVKQHRQGAQGNLVAGEEELRKLIVYWGTPTPDANLYELCHNCRVRDTTGERYDETIGTAYPIEVEGGGNRCAGNMCYVFPGAPLGKNRFNLRVRTADGWSVWSEHVNFEVDKPGNPPHVHHEL